MNGKIVRAFISTCKHCAFPSTNNEVQPTPLVSFDGPDHVEILKALDLFAGSLERSMLTLELDNGLEISLVPSLTEESAKELEAEPYYPEFKPKWEIKVEVWPVP